MPCTQSNSNILSTLKSFTIMPNWCNTTLVFEGDKQEIKTLYQTMKKLERRKTPLVKNDFGVNWLGCLVEALGGQWKEIYCRGTWLSLECQGNILRMETETAWSPCIETYDFICKVFPSLAYYYRSEEPMMAEYLTNDMEGRHFKACYHVDAIIPNGDYVSECFNSLEEALHWVADKSGCAIQSEADVEALNEQWHTDDDEGYCYLHHYRVV